MDVMTAIRTRRTIRSYRDQPIEEEKIEQLLTAMQWAPGGRNEQDHMIVVVRDPALRNGLVPACAGQKFIATAPVVLAICYTNERIMMCNQSVRVADATIAFSFLLLAAQELGLGMCWIGAFDAEAVRRVLDIPESYTVLALAPIGYPAVEGTPKGRKHLDDLVRYDNWKKRGE